MRVTRAVGAGAALLAAMTLLGFGPQSMPDPGRSVQALALDGKGRLLVGTFGKGIYRSADGGKHWEALSTGLGDPFVMTFLIESDDVIYAGTARQGVFRTRDGGRSWEKKAHGLRSTEVPVIVMDANKTMFIGTGNGVYKSADRGDTWTPHNTGLDSVLVRSLILDARGELLAGTGGNGLFHNKPTDAAWKQVTRGFRGGGNTGLLENYIRTLTVDRKTGAMYAGTFDGGIYMSDDHGGNWSFFGDGMDNGSIRAVIVGPDRQLFAATGDGVYARKPGEASWRLVSRGLEDDNVQSMVVAPNGEIYAGTASGLYKGSPGGGWTPIHDGLYAAQPGT